MAEPYPDYMTLKASELKCDIEQTLNITLPGKLTRKDLRSIYKENLVKITAAKQRGHNDRESADISTVNNVNPTTTTCTSEADQQTRLERFMERTELSLHSLKQQFQDLKQSNATSAPQQNDTGNGATVISSLTQTVASPSPQTVIANGNSVGVPLETLQCVDVVSESVKRKIWDFKYVDLATLLVPNYESQRPMLTINDSDGGKTLNLNIQDDNNHIKDYLTISEFVLAFGRYKRIMLQKYPARKEELDSYERGIIEIHSFLGNKYYDYHKLFTSRASAAMLNEGTKVDWSKPDRLLLQLVSMGKVPCAICGTINQACRHSKNNKSDTKQFQRSGVGQKQVGVDRRGRKIVYHEGKAICNNYNEEGGCRLPGCNNLHVCAVAGCRKADHGVPKCPIAKN